MKAAIILNGCGAKDGSEIQEAVFSMCALQEQKFEIRTFALDELQHELIDHLRNVKVPNGQRNMLVEAARIARGAIAPLQELNPQDFSILLIPGGFGTAKNLCNYATQGTQMQVHKSIEKIIRQFYEDRKPIGAICIAPILVGKVLGKHAVKLTSGNDTKLCQDLQSFGCVHEVCEKGECVVDEKNLIVSTPAYMYADSTMPEIFRGIQRLAQELRRLSQG